MTTIIDSLLIEIGIDPARFTKDYKNYLARLNEVKDQTKKQATGIEEHGKKIGETFSTITSRLLGLTAVFVGARGVVDFVTNITHADNALGRFSTQIGVGVSSLSNWRNAGQLMGGTAEGIDAVFSKLNDEVQQFKFTGESSLIPLFRTLSAAGGHIVEITQPVDEMFKSIVANIAEIAKTNPRGANYLARLFGADEATAAAMVRGPAAIQKMVNASKELGEVTDADVAASNRRAEGYNKIAIAATNAGRAIATFLTPITAPVEQGIVNFFTDIYKLARSGTTPGFLTPGKTFAESLETKWKPGQKGNIQPGTDVLASLIRGATPDLAQFTAGNDTFHRGTGSEHAKGLALDFTLAGGTPAKYRETEAKLRSLYGSGARFDYHPTGFAGSTADHIHAAFASEAAAAKFGSQHNETVNISTVNINVGSGDPEKIKAALLAAGRQRLAAQANSGLQ